MFYGILSCILQATICLSSTSEPTEVFMWGDNTNATLGHDKMQARRQPEVVDYFRKRAISITEVRHRFHWPFAIMEKFSCSPNTLEIL